MIGTPAYMSPEQVAGKPLDRRTDIWSFGCVLFEMLTGSKAFAGDSVGSLFAAIATENPQLDLVADAPPPVRQLIERCLRKDPRTRLRDIGDARIELEEIIAGRAETEPEGEPARRRPVLTGLALLVGGLVGALAMSQPTAKSEPTPEPIAQYSIPLFPPPSTLHLDGPTGAASPLAIARDGRQVVFSAIDASGERLLYLRRAGDARPTKIQNTAGAEAPFFSFDGSQVGFYVSGGAKLRCVTLADSSVKDLFESIVIRGSSWAADGSIVFADTDLGIRRLTMVDGKPHVEEITTVSAEEHHHRWPQILPDGEHVLFSVLLRNRSVEPRIVSLRTKKVVRIDLQGSLVRYLDGGYLVYTKADHIWAVRFDLAAQEKVGDPVRVLSGIYVPQLGNPHVALNADGVLVYEPFRPPSPGRTLVWVERDGSKQVIASDRNYEFPRLSPDGSQLVFADHGKTNSHSICRINLLRKPYKSQQITTDGNYIEPTWSPKGDAIIFSEFRELNLWIMRLGGVEKRLLDRVGWQYPCQWREGVLLFEESTSRAGDLVEVRLDNLSPSEPRVLLATIDDERGVQVSPDGRWMAYVSDRTARPEVYLRSYPEVGEPELVSADGGTEPLWSRDGSELFYRKGNVLFAVPIEDGRIGDPKPLFQGPYVEGFHARPNYDVSNDGKRFVMVDGGAGLTQRRLKIHLNLTREIEEKLRK
ncbi:MAG: protein kinase domain-containing protein [Planctomycetota bacterium]